ncbi:MAG: Aminotransferase [uncultured bacterium]|nr:MAG: Aminotransferase [uncultured bacterium]
MIDIKKIRSDFPILNEKIYGRALVYLDNAATTQKPLVVLNKTTEFNKTINSNIHRGVHYLSEQASTAYENARKTVKDFINARSVTEVIFTRSTTESINLLADSFGNTYVREGDEVIITEMEHHSNIVPWQVLCERKGACLKVLPFDENGVILIDNLQDLINIKTKLISISHVSNALGIINPVKDVIRIAHQHNIPVLIDGAQSIQHLPVDVQDFDCDFLAFSGHKMYAETGVGILYGKEKWLEAMPPYQTGGGMITSVSFDETKFAGLPQKFEAGTVNYVGAISLAVAIDYLRGIGIKNVLFHERELLNYIVKQLNELDDLTIYGNSPHRCGAVSFNLNGIHPYDAGMILDRLGIAIRTGNHCAEPVMRHFGIGGTIRASFAMYNTREEIDMLINGIKKAREMLL